MKVPFSISGLIIVLILSASHFASADCNLKITRAGPCLGGQYGRAYGNQQVGDVYWLRVDFHVSGTPNRSFRVKYKLANKTFYSSYISASSGGNYWWYNGVTIALDDSMPWSVILDPDGFSGNTNLADTASGIFTPIPPTNTVELYSPRLMHGFETYTLNFQTGSGNLNNLWVLFGDPTTHGAQQILSVTPPANSRQVFTPPYGVPLFEIARTNVPAAIFQDTNQFVAQLNRIRVNPSILRTNTWEAMSAMTTNWMQWTAPDQRVQSTNALITGFVQQSLPTNYQAVLTPYDTARTLHRAVMAKLKYQSPPLHLDAVSVLQDGVADCGGFAALLTACLRNVGIPARCISGFRQGDTVWHVRTEFHLPGVEWLVADPTDGDGQDSTGTYAYYFGFVPNADSFIAVDTGDAHVMPYHTFEFIQVPNWWWSGGGTYNSYTAAAYLQPNGVLTSASQTNGSFQFLMKDVPTAGSVIVQTSTNLLAWTPVATNSAGGTNINYSFYATNEVRRFYRANVVP